MSRKTIIFVHVYVAYFLIFMLLIQSTRPVQSIALSSLCGEFGHSCFGGNWGKREVLESSVSSNINPITVDNKDDRTKIIIENYKNILRNLLAEQMRWENLRHRLNQLLEPQVP